MKFWRVVKKNYSINRGVCEQDSLISLKFISSFFARYNTGYVKGFYNQIRVFSTRNCHNRVYSFVSIGTLYSGNLVQNNTGPGKVRI